jgi:hypothetical protein
MGGNHVFMRMEKQKLYSVLLIAMVHGLIHPHAMSLGLKYKNIIYIHMRQMGGMNVHLQTEALR